MQLEHSNPLEIMTTLIDSVFNKAVAVVTLTFVFCGWLDSLVIMNVEFWEYGHKILIAFTDVLKFIAAIMAVLYTSNQAMPTIKKIMAMWAARKNNRKKK